MANNNTFANEILLKIFEGLYLDSKTLYSAALVCKNWVRPAQTVLFHFVYIDMEVGARRLLASAPLERFLIGEVELCDLKANVFAEILVRARVRRFTVRDAEGTLDFGLFGSSNLKDLTHISIRDSKVHSLSVPTSFPFSLKELVVKNCGFYSFLPLSLLWSSTLTRLSLIEDCEDPWSRENQLELSKLLDLAAPFLVDLHLSVTFVEILVKPFSSCHRLSYLEIFCKSSVLDSIVSTLPSQLKHLRLERIDRDGALVQSVMKALYFPSLVQLQSVTVHCDREDFDRKVKKVFKGRGIRLDIIDRNDSTEEEDF